MDKLELLASIGNRVFPPASSISGNSLVTTSDCRGLTLYRLDPFGPQYTTCSKYESNVWSIAHSENVGIIAVSHDNGEMTIWDLETGELRYKDQPFEDDTTIHSFTFSSDGSFLVITTSDWGAKHIFIWDIEERDIVQEFYSNNNPKIALSPDDELIAVAGWGADVIALLDIRTAERQKNIITDPDYADMIVSDIEFSPNGRLVAVSGTERAMVYDIESEEIVAEFAPGGHRVMLDFSADGEWLAAKGVELVLWRTDGSAEPIFTDDSSYHSCLSWKGNRSDVGFLNGSEQLVSYQAEGITVWDVEALILNEHIDSGAVCEDFGLLADGNLMIAGARTELISVPQLTSYRVVDFPELAHLSYLLGVSIFSSGFIAAGDSNIYVADLDSAPPLRIVKDTVAESNWVKPLEGIAVHPEGAPVASYTAGYTLISGQTFTDQSIRLWDPETGNLTNQFNTSFELSFTLQDIVDFEFSPASQTFAVGGRPGWYGHLGIMGANGSLHRVIQLGGSVSQVNDLEFSPDGNYLAISVDWEALYVYDLTTGIAHHVVDVYPPHMSFSPDGSLIVLGGGEQVSIVDWRTKDTVASIGRGGVPRWVYGYSDEYWPSIRTEFSADGKLIILAGGGILSLWGVPAEQPDS